jgi:hypothetical protein
MQGRVLEALAVFALSLGFALSVHAQPAKSQAKPDFSGVWLLDQKKSNDPGLTRRSDLPIKISHHAPEFRVTIPTELNGQVTERDFIYFTDGRGETNPLTSFVTTNPAGIKADELKKQVSKSKTKWSGNKVVTRSELSVQAGPQTVSFEQVDEWKLSDDGKILIQTSRIIHHDSGGLFIPAMVPDKKRVYNRQ